MRLKNIVANTLVTLCFAFLFLLIILGIGLRWRECRRIHPWWYCMESTR